MCFSFNLYCSHYLIYHCSNLYHVYKIKYNNNYSLDLYNGDLQTSTVHTQFYTSLIEFLLTVACFILLFSLTNVLKAKCSCSRILENFIAISLLLVYAAYCVFAYVYLLFSCWCYCWFAYNKFDLQNPTLLFIRNFTQGWLNSYWLLPVLSCLFICSRLQSDERSQSRIFVFSHSRELYREKTLLIACSLTFISFAHIDVVVGLLITSSMYV